jgi:hypothetical protein
MNKDLLLEIISEVSGIPKILILKKNRTRKYLVPRQIYTYLLRKVLKMTLKEIGDILNSDHTTVIHSVKKVEILLEIEDEILCNIYYDVEQRMRMLIKEPLRYVLTFPADRLLINEIEDIQKNYSCNIERFSHFH